MAEVLRNMRHVERKRKAEGDLSEDEEARERDDDDDPVEVVIGNCHRGVMLMKESQNHNEKTERTPGGEVEERTGGLMLSATLEWEAPRTSYKRGVFLEV